jgi:ribosomal protein S18 acetylase RimI-like enzyme
MPSLDDCGVCDDYASGNDEGTDVGCLAELGSDETAQSDGTADRMQQPGKTLFTCVAVGGDEEHSARICGCVVGCFLRARSHLSPRLRNLLLPSHHERAFYIMTLGVVRSRRKSGLGSHLVQLCQRLVEQDPDCGVLYLHVITFNAGAIRLYENLGFYRVEEIVDYYTIGGKQYNALLFAKYFHGNRGHRDLFSLAKETAAVFWRQVVGTLPVLLRYLSRPLSQQAPRIQHHD